MWITRAEYRELSEHAAAAKAASTLVEQLRESKALIATMRADNAETRAKELKLTEQLAQLRSSFEWLTNHVNRLERERAELFARVLNLQLPAMELQRQQEPSTSPSSIAGTPGDAYENTIPALQAAGALFEDVGDDAAGRMGIAHDNMGNVKWTR